MGSSRQEYWSGLPWPPSGDLPDPRINPLSLMSSALVGMFFITNATWEAPTKHADKHCLWNTLFIYLFPLESIPLLLVTVLIFCGHIAPAALFIQGAGRGAQWGVGQGASGRGVNQSAH